MLAYMALQTSSEMHIWAPSMQFESIFMAGAVLLHRFPGVLLSMLLQTFAKSVGCLIALKHALGGRFKCNGNGDGRCVLLYSAISVGSGDTVGRGDRADGTSPCQAL